MTPARPAIRIGVLEDDVTLAKMYQALLAKSGYECRCYGTIGELIGVLIRESFDVLLLDWTLPDGTAETVLKWVRENLGWEIPVIVISGNDEENNIVNALWLGADDYLVKPMRMLETIARIEAQMRSKRVSRDDSLQLGPYAADLGERTLRLSGRRVELTQKEFDLAVHMLRNPGKLLSRVELLKQVWGTAAEIDTRTVDAHVSRLRRKLQLDGANGWIITPVYGYGYRFGKCEAAQESHTA